MEFFEKKFSRMELVEIWRRFIGKFYFVVKGDHIRFL
jgi:hypothetical protein